MSGAFKDFTFREIFKPADHGVGERTENGSGSDDRRSREHDRNDREDDGREGDAGPDQG